MGCTDLKIIFDNACKPHNAKISSSSPYKYGLKNHVLKNISLPNTKHFRGLHPFQATNDNNDVVMLYCCQIAELHIFFKPSGRRPIHGII